MTQQVTAVAAYVINILVIVDIPFARPLSARNLWSVGLLVPGVMGYAAGKNLFRVL